MDAERMAKLYAARDAAEAALVAAREAMYEALEERDSAQDSLFKALAINERSLPNALLSTDTPTLEI